MKVLKDGEEPETKKQSYKNWKDKAKPGPKAKPTKKPLKKPKVVLTDEEVARLNTLNNRTKDKQIAKQQQEDKAREALGLGPNDVVPTNWITGGTKFNLEAMTVFCEEYAKHTLLSKAALIAGVSQSTVRNYLKSNPLFQDMVADAKQIYRDKIVETIYERSVIGFEEPIIGGIGRDMVVAYKRVYSDRLLELEAKRIEHGYRDKGGIEINTGSGVLVVQAGNMNEDQWKETYGEMKQAEE